ncbi:MAG: SPOR domain-containing protein [Saprospiraceae bacterium]|nr:SPOR domain-containing protein [Saprospiraceae bacterium]
MKDFLFFSLIYFCFAITLMQGQYSVKIESDQEIANLVNQYVRINKSITHVSGWRITVISTSDRRQMEETKTLFQKNFNYKFKWEYKEPYYQLTAGAFINRNEALAALDQVKKKFQNAFISIDHKIEYAELQ